MIKTEALIALEEFVGYPIRDPLLLGQLDDDDSDDEYLERLIVSNVDLRAEFYGTEPALGYEEDAATRTDTVCRHFSGLYCPNTVGPEELKTGLKGRPVAISGLEFVELNPDAAPMGAVYFSGPSTGMPRWWLFKSLADAADFDRRTFKLDSGAPDFAERLKSLGADYPRACAWMKGAFKRKFGASLESVVSVDTEENSRLFKAFDAFGPIAEVLIARADGQRLNLSARDAKVALGAAAGSDYTPFLLLELLALALSGETSKSEALATTIVEQNRGVPLTQRWAKMVLEATGPFGTEPSLGAKCTSPEPQDVAEAIARASAR